MNEMDSIPFGHVMKFVLITIPNHEENQSNSTLDEVKTLTITMPVPPLSSKSKEKFQNKAIGIFEKMAENSTYLMICFERNNNFFRTLTINLIISSINYSTM